MALPFAASAIVGATSGFIGQWFAASFLPSVRSTERTKEYAENVAVPNLRPDPQTLMNLYYKGEIDLKALKALLLPHGVPDKQIKGDVSSRNLDAWSKVIHSNLPAFDPQLLRVLLLTKGWTFPQVQEHLKRLGVLDPGVQESLIFQSQPFNADQINTLYLRNDLEAGEYDLYMKLAGLTGDRERELAQGLRFQIPGPSDIIQFALKDAWDQEVVKEFRYAEEFPPELQYWLAQQGLDWKEDIPDGKGGTTPGVTWPLLYWTQHWQNLSPGYAYQFQHRFRGDPADPKTWRVPGVRPWNAADTSRILKINDYAPAFRDRLAALSYNIISRLDIRRLYQTGIIDRFEVAEIYQDHGYTTGDANKLAGLVVKQDRIRLSNRVTEDTKGKILQLYKVGVITFEDMKRRLYSITLDDPKDKEFFDGLLAVEQDALANANFAVVHTAEVAQLEITMGEISQSLTSIRKSFMSGHTSEDEAKAALTNLGVQLPRIERYIRIWKLQLYGKYQELSTGNVLKYYQRGIIPEYIATQRLINLGWRLDDIKYLFANVAYDQETVAAKARLAGIKDLKKQQEAKAKLIAAQQKQLEKDREKLAKEAKPAELLKWTLQGIITEGMYLNKMLAMGHTLEYARDLLLSSQTPPPDKPKKEKPKNGKKTNPEPSPSSAPAP